MSRTETVLEEASSLLRGTVGGLATMLVLRRGVSERTLKIYAARLRAAADKLEELT